MKLSRLETMARERDHSAHKHQELLQDYQRKQESTMDTQLKDVIALKKKMLPAYRTSMMMLGTNVSTTMMRPWHGSRR